MSITLDTISRFAGTGQMLVNAQGTGFESVGILQRLKSFFNIGDAREKNRATLSVISTAVLSDPRFAVARDLQEHAERLLGGVRTDRAIDAARIKSIVKELEYLASGSQAMIDERVDMHLAAGKIPDELRSYTSKYTSQIATIAKQQAKRPGAGGAMCMVDVAEIVRDVADHCRAALEAVSELPDSNVDELSDFVGRHLDLFVVDRDGSLRSFEAIKDGGEFCRLASRGARCRLREISPPSYNEIEQATPYEMAAAEFLAEVDRPVSPALYAKVEQAVRDNVKQVNLGKHPNAETARAALDGMARRILANPIQDDDGTTLFAYDDRAFKALERYVTRLVALNQSYYNRVTICRLLNVQSIGEELAKAVSEAKIAAGPKV